MMVPTMMESFFKKNLKMKKTLKSLNLDGSPLLTTALEMNGLSIISRLDMMNLKDQPRRITARLTPQLFTESLILPTRALEQPTNSMDGATLSDGLIMALLMIPSSFRANMMNLKVQPRKIMEKLIPQSFTENPILPTRASEQPTNSMDGQTLLDGPMMVPLTTQFSSD
jgi:hypothetical protein